MRLKKIIAFFISISVLLIAFSLFYYLVIFLPKKEQAKLDLQKQEQNVKEQILQINEETIQRGESEKAERPRQLNQCLDAAKSENSRQLELLLSWAERENKDGKYDLTGAFDSLEKKLDKALEECYKKYPQN